MFHAYFLPLTAIFAVGTFGAEKLRKKKFIEFTFYEWFAESWLIGSFFLIIPMVLVSLLFDNRLHQVVYSYYSLALVILLYYILNASASIKPSQVVNKDTIKKITRYNSYTMLLIFLLLGYTIIALLLPERGWDALQFYLPNSIYFFLEDDIPPTINPFTFFPTFKPPSNTMYLVYLLYTTKGFYAHLLPVVFLVAIVCVTVIFGIDLGLSKRHAKLASIFLLTTPSIYITMLEYSFYQELPLTFFYSMSLVYYQKGLKTGDKSNFILSSFAVSLTVLSKLSGFTVIILIIILFPITMKKNETWFKYGGLLIFALFLTRKAIYDTFIGTGIAIMIISIGLGLQLRKIKRKEIGSYLDLRANFIGFVLTLSIFLISLIIWLQHMLKFPNTMKFLRNLYFERNSSSISWHFTSNKMINETYFETAHSINFIMSVIPILIASQFGLFLLLPKIIGIKEAFKKYPVVNLWLGTFYIFWLAFHSQVSIRYLSVIWVPLVIITVLGIEEIIVYFKIQQYSDQIFLFLILTNFLFYYSFIPIEFINLDFHSRLYQYHTSLFRLLLYFIAFWGAMLLIFRSMAKKTKNPKNNINSRKYKKKRNISIFILSSIIIIAPISAQFTILVYTGFDRDEFQSIWVYDNRIEVRELVDFMNDLNFDIEEITVVVNIPGLGYWLNRPVIDLLFADRYLEVNQSTILTNQNITESFEDLKENNIEYVVTLQKDHVYYKSYRDRFETNYPFLAMINSTFAFSMFSNHEFELWQLI